MSAITLQVTSAGRAALVNPDNTGTLPLLVAQIGITDQVFTAAADGSDTALPGELKRLTTFAGDAVAADTIHVSITDDTADTYSLRGFGMYFSDGTLFALYGQADPIMEKSALAMMLLALDAIFQTLDVANLTFGDTNFALPPATTDKPGIVELATEAEADAGTDTVRAITPAALKGATDARLGAGAPSVFVKTLLTAATAIAFRAMLAIKGAALKDEGAGNGLDADLLDGQHGSYYRAWANLTDVPASFPPLAHTHAWSDITGAPAQATRWADWTEVTNKPATFTPSPHSQDWATILNIPATASRWPAWGEVTNKPDLLPTAGGTVTGPVQFQTPDDGGSHTALSIGPTDPLKQLHVTMNTGVLTWDYAGWYGAGVMKWAYGGAPKMQLDDGGNLVVVGQVTAAGYGAVNATTGTFSGSVKSTGSLAGWEFHARTDDTQIWVWYADSGAAHLYSADGGNNCTINQATGAWAFSAGITAPGFESVASSRKVKHDIAPCRYGLDEFLQIPWVEYRYDASVTPDDRLRFGSLVEGDGVTPGVEDFAQELVIRREGQVPTFEYDQFIPVIGRALQQYIAANNARIAALEARLAALESRA